MLKRLFNGFLKASETLAVWQQVFGSGGLLAAFGVTAWAASATDWISQFGVLGWVLSGFLGMLMMSAVYLILSYSIELVARGKYFEAKTKPPTHINILEDRFDSECIVMSDVWSYHHYEVRDKDFRRCRFEGPMSVAFLDMVSIQGSKFSDCNFVIIENDTFLTGIVGFRNSFFRDCEFDCVTFFLPRSMAQAMNNDLAQNGRPIRFVGAPLNAKRQ